MFQSKEKEPSNRQNSRTIGWGPWEEEECLRPSVWEGIPALERKLGPALTCPLLTAPRCSESLAVMPCPALVWFSVSPSSSSAPGWEPLLLQPVCPALSEWPRLICFSAPRREAGLLSAWLIQAQLQGSKGLSHTSCKRRLHTDAVHHSGYSGHTQAPSPFMSLAGYSQPRDRSRE